MVWEEGLAFSVQDKGCSKGSLPLYHPVCAWGCHWVLMVGILSICSWWYRADPGFVEKTQFFFLLFLERHPQAGQRAVRHSCLLQECSFQWLWRPQSPSSFLWDVIVHREQSSETSSGVWYVCSALAKGHPMSQSSIKWQLVVIKHEAPQSHRSQAVTRKGIFCRQFTHSARLDREALYTAASRKSSPNHWKKFSSSSSSSYYFL